jgi:hypothetical protein
MKKNTIKVSSTKTWEIKKLEYGFKVYAFTKKGIYKHKSNFEYEEDGWSLEEKINDKKYINLNFWTKINKFEEDVLREEYYLASI